jgi:hypothetical protein
MQTSEPNIIFDLQASLMDCRSHQEFVKKLQNFIDFELPIDRKINLNSLFKADIHPFYRNQLGLLRISLQVFRKRF